MRVRLLARLCGALYYSPEREPDAGAQRRGDRASRTELGDPEARALAAARAGARCGRPAICEQRLADSTELLTLRARGRRPRARAPGPRLAGRRPARAAATATRSTRRCEAFTAGAERLRQPLYMWHAAVWRAMRALLDGRLEQADGARRRGAGDRAQAETMTAPQYYAIQLLAIRREQGRMGELEAAAARARWPPTPHRPAWRAALATLLRGEPAGRGGAARARRARRARISRTSRRTATG